MLFFPAIQLNNTIIQVIIDMGYNSLYFHLNAAADAADISASSLDTVDQNKWKASLFITLKWLTLLMIPKFACENQHKTLFHFVCVCKHSMVHHHKASISQTCNRPHTFACCLVIHSTVRCPR